MCIRDRRQRVDGRLGSKRCPRCLRSRFWRRGICGQQRGGKASGQDQGDRVLCGNEHLHGCSSWMSAGVWRKSSGTSGIAGSAIPKASVRRDLRPMKSSANQWVWAICNGLTVWDAPSKPKVRNFADWPTSKKTSPPKRGARLNSESRSNQRELEDQGPQAAKRRPRSAELTMQSSLKSQKLPQPCPHCVKKMPASAPFTMPSSFRS